MIDVYHDGYKWCALLNGDFLGRFDNRDAAFAFAYLEKCRLAGVPCK